MLDKQKRNKVLFLRTMFLEIPYINIRPVYFFQLCIQNNPEEARHMLLQNPQLAYALLQAQVIMKIVDPKVADVSTFCIFSIRYYSQHLKSRQHFGQICSLELIIFPLMRFELRLSVISDW